MLISTHPRDHTGNPLWARSYVHIFRSPGFQPEMIPVHTLGSIGCGTSYPPCRAAVEAFSSDPKRRALFVQGEVGMQGGMATILGFDLTELLLRTPGRNQLASALLLGLPRGDHDQNERSHTEGAVEHPGEWLRRQSRSHHARYYHFKASSIGRRRYSVCDAAPRGDVGRTRSVPHCDGGEG